MTDSEVIGHIVRDKILDLLKLLWSGSVTASREDSRIAIMYLVLGLVMVAIGFATDSWGIVFLVLFSVTLVIGIWRYIKEAPFRKKQRFFRDVFYTMKFYASGDIYPSYVTESEVSEYTRGFAFETLIPVSSWIARKDELEMYFGEKILRIRHDYDDSRIMFVFVQVKPLPSCLEWNDKHITINNTLSIGSSHFNTIGMNLETHPHAFIAGETGSGKSNILKCFIYQALKKNYDVVLIDFKRGVSFSAFSDKITIYYEYPEVVQVLNAMVEETKRRLDRFRETGVDNIADYNNLHANAHSSGKSQGYMSRKIVFIDELAELLKTRDKEISNALNDSIETLTRLARAVGIHLIMGIQRPDSTIVSGQIKNNVSFRICGRFVDKEPRRIMLGTDTASSLPNVKGRFIVKDDGIHEAQAFYFHDGKYKANNRNNTVNSHKHKDEVVNIAQQAIRQAQERQEASAIYATQAPQPLYEQGLTTQGEADGYIEDQPPVLAIQGESSGKQVEVPKDSEEEAPKDTEAETIHFDFSSFGK